MKTISFALLLSYFWGFSSLSAQNVTVSISDVINFWETYDSVQTTTERSKRLDFIQKLYLDRGSEGLKEAKVVRNVTAENLLNSIENNKDDLVKKRPLMLSVLKQMPLIEKKLARLKDLYTDFKGGSVYFLVGHYSFGGTIKGNHCLIGTEVISTEKEDWAVETVLHEFIHTMEAPCNGHFLANVINEGMADFGAELAYGDKTLAELYPNKHTAFGLKNEQAVWSAFKKYLHLTEGGYYDWLYGTKGRSINGVTMKDLGYFMGYQFCKSYYNKAADKKKAFKEMLEWDLSTDEKAREFLLASGYLTKKDEKFVRKMVFSRIAPELKVGKLKIIGYRLVKDEIVFTYDAITPAKQAVQSVCIAGNFNEWKPNVEGYILKKISAAQFELRLPTSKFEKGKVYQFKFVLNENLWQDPPLNAKNTAMEGGYLNLAFSL